jgi:WD40 repeat protein
VWRTDDWQQIGNPFASDSLPNDTIESLAFSPDSQVLAIGSFDGTVQLWDTATDQEIGNPLVSASIDTGQVRSLAFSPDGKTLAASSQTGAVQLWNLAGLVSVAQKKQAATESGWCAVTCAGTGPGASGSAKHTLVTASSAGPTMAA